MVDLSLKPTDKAVKKYYHDLAQKRQMHLIHEGSVAPIFADLLNDCARRFNYTLSEQYPHKRLRFDGAVLTEYKLRIGVWEAKDEADDLDAEIEKKFRQGYPKDNILFQTPSRAVLIQNGSRVGDFDLTRPDQLTRALEAFLSYRAPAFDQWERAVADFKARVPEIARALMERIDAEYAQNKDFKAAFDDFYELGKTSLNPNLSAAAVKEMIIQHLMTERIFRRVLDNPDFVRRNVIAAEIERVVDALVRRHFNREAFFRPLEPFYHALEQAARIIDDYAEKQTFLNTVYEQFFQGFSVKTADTLGIVYTPQPIVSFMVESVADILRREWGRGLEDEGVHILDPFVGTGNFILRVMQHIAARRKSALPHKYRHELHANEVMLLPYYIASMNIEHAYYEAVGSYEPFPGICLVDTFELYEGRQRPLPGLGGENVARVEQQKRQPIFVVIGNPPYNVGQVNENDNNKNRKYPKLDARVRETYAKASRASSKSKLDDPYVKAFRWASDRIGDEGVVAFVSNNSFLDNIAFDGMRQHLAADFSAIYHLNFKGNARTSGERRRREGGNIFDDLIRVSVGITFLVRRKDHQGPARLYLHSVDDYLKAKDKRSFLERAQSLDGVAWQTLQPNARHVWLTEGLHDDWADLLPLGTKEAKSGRDAQTIFGLYSLGVNTARDAWAYNFSREALAENMRRTIEAYNLQVMRWQLTRPKPASVDAFVEYDDKKLSWSRDLKLDLKRGKMASFEDAKLRRSLYRPFTSSHVFFDKIMNEEVYQQYRIFPTPQTEAENRAIVVTNIGNTKPFHCLMTNVIFDYHLTGDSQCFPLYVYDEDGTNRRENVTDWALQQFRQRHRDESIGKEDIFY
ncbi:MAG: type ISP restriction/modification enzyme, partial [Anaerolineae bacterium]